MVQLVKMLGQQNRGTYIYSIRKDKLNNFKNQNMTQLETLKLEVDALAEKINSAMAVNEDSVTLTREQLRDFAQVISEDIIFKVKEAIEDVNIDIEDHVSLELNRFELEVNVDRSDVLAEIVSSMDDPDDVTDEDVVRYLDILKK